MITVALPQNKEDDGITQCWSNCMLHVFFLPLKDWGNILSGI